MPSCEYYLNTRPTSKEGNYDYFIRITTPEPLTPAFDPRILQIIEDLSAALIRSQPSEIIQTINNQGFKTFSGVVFPLDTPWQPESPSPLADEVLNHTPGLVPDAIRVQHLWNRFETLVLGQIASFPRMPNPKESAASAVGSGQTIAPTIHPQSSLNELHIQDPYEEIPPPIQYVLMRHLFYLPGLRGNLEEKTKKYFEERAKRENTHPNALYCRELSRLKQPSRTLEERILDDYYQGKSVTEALRTVAPTERFYADFRTLAINSGVLVEDSDREWAIRHYLEREYLIFAIQAVEKSVFDRF